MTHSERFYLTQYNLSHLISAMESGVGQVEVSPDLNLSQTMITIEENRVILGGRFLTLEELKSLSKKLSGILLIKDGEMEALELFADGFYKLRPTEESSPTIEIDGVQMHRTKNVNPWEDSRRKATHTVRQGDTALDTCGGLGYTAIWAVKLGAEKVVTVEKNPHIISLRKLNPHSEGLGCEKIVSLEGDIVELVKDFDEGQFDSIIHDPPRFSLAGELYGLDFYRSLRRVLKDKGRMFHYTGEPYRRGRGRRFLEGVMKRLEEAGFSPRHLPEDLGILCGGA